MQPARVQRLRAEPLPLYCQQLACDRTAPSLELLTREFAVRSMRSGSVAGAAHMLNDAALPQSHRIQLHRAAPTPVAQCVFSTLFTPYSVQICILTWRMVLRCPSPACAPLRRSLRPPS